EQRAVEPERNAAGLEMDEVGDDVRRVRQEDQPERDRGRQHEQSRAAAVAVVDDERDDERDPRQGQVPEQEPESRIAVMELSDEFEPHRERGRKPEAEEHEETFARMSARAQWHAPSAYRATAFGTTPRGFGLPG